jgi:hypothetical protein
MWDQELPEAGHEARFQARLKTQNGRFKFGNAFLFHKPAHRYMIAASLLILISTFSAGLLTRNLQRSEIKEYAPEIALAADHFESIIQNKAKLLQVEYGDETRPVVESALNQLKKLESDYLKMVQDLRAGGNSKLILNAMLRNFRMRIELIESVLAQIEQLKDLKYELKTL